MRIGPEGSRGTIANALEACGEYGLLKTEAEDRIRRIVKCVSLRWRELAAELGLQPEQVRGLEQGAMLGTHTGAASYR